MSTLGPRVQKLRQKELATLGPVENDYQKFKEGSVSEKIKLIRIRPDIALGAAAGREIEEVQYRIYFIILSALILAILTTVAYTTLKGESRMREYLVGAFSISWFLFVSFIFLLFDATRLLHILLFGIILGLSSVVYEKIDREEPLINKETQNIILASTVFGAIAFCILLYYYFTSRKEEELIELKTGETIRKRNTEITKLVKEAYNKGKEEGAKETREKLGLYEKIGEKAIDNFLKPKSVVQKKSKKATS